MGTILQHFGSRRQLDVISKPSRFLCVLFRQERKRVLRDHQLLVGRHEEEDDPAFRPRDQGFAIRISRRIKNGAKPCKRLGNARADRWRVLADAGREHEGIEPAQRSREHPGIEPDAVHEMID